MDYPVSEEAVRALEGSNQLISNLMQCSEKKCHELHKAHYEFSPKIKWWLDRCHAFRQLLMIQTRKKVRNHGNIKRFARRCRIDNPMQHVQTMQSEHKKADGIIPVDEKIIPLIPTPTSNGR